MITRQGRSELSEADQKAIKDIIAIGKESISPEAFAHLNARRNYLTEDIQEEFGLGDFAPKKVTPNAPKKTGEGEGEKGNPDYKKMKKPELLDLCEERGIEADEQDTVKELIETLEADDRGELEEA